MGTKAFIGCTHQFLLKNQAFPPVLTAGEYNTDSEKQSEEVSIGNTNGKAKLVLGVLSPMDLEVISSFLDSGFRSYLVREFSSDSESHLVLSLGSKSENEKHT
eukprot:15365683-Ditylum_brightwellii.AAC.2